MAGTPDPWETTTGLLEEFDFEAKDGWFGFDDTYNEGKSLLFKLRGIATIDGEIEDDEHVLRYGCGDGWQDAKGGDEAKHKAGANQFNNKTAMGYLIDRFKELGAVDMLRERGKPTQAATFAGLNMHMKREAVNTFTPKGQTEAVTQYVTLPTEILEAVKATKAKASSARSRRAKKDEDEEEEEEAPKPTRTRKPRAKKKTLRDEVVEFAADFDSHEDFVSAVFDPDEFDKAEEAEEDEELAEEILDAESELWEESRS
jgi:hypothetical protein